MKTEIIETRKNKDGTMVRLQKRGEKFDVVKNTTGFCWRYVEGAKGVTERQARDAFFFATLGE